jgi:hypothetical protein
MNKFLHISFAIFWLIALSGCNGFQYAEWKQDLTVLQREAEAEEQNLEQPPVKELANEFINRLVQEVDDHYKVTNFTSKYELMKYMSEIASEELAKKVVNFYYKEQEDGLYIVPTELMPWFVEGNDYQLKQLDKQTYELTQMNESNLYGKYNITIQFIYQNEGWKIKNFHSKQHQAS